MAPSNEGGLQGVAGKSAPSLGSTVATPSSPPLEAIVTHKSALWTQGVH